MAAARQSAANGAGQTAGDGPAKGERRRVLTQRLKEAGEAAFSRLVRGRSDAQLERTIGSAAGLRIVFKAMERAYLPERANGFTGDIQYELKTSQNGRANGASRNWVVHLGPDGARAEPGVAQDPKVTFRASVPTFVRIAAGEIHPAKAILEGDMGVYGDYQVAMRLPEMFGQQLLV